LPRSQRGSRTTLRQLASDGSDSDTLKKGRSYEKSYLTHEPLQGKPNIEFPAKKWDLDEEDFTSSEGGSEFPQGRLAKDMSYDDTPQQQPPQQQQQQSERQTGRRNQRQQQPDTIQEENYLTRPAEVSPGFSPVYSGFSGSQGRPPSGGIRVLPTSNKFFSDATTASPVSSGSPVLTQNVGLPSPPLNNRSTEV